MELNDTLRLVFNSMKYKRLRTVLTVIGIMVGPAAIVALLTITNSFAGNIVNQLTKIGSTTIYVTPGGRLALTPTTVASIEKLPNVTIAVPYYSFSGNVHGNSSESISLYAVNFADLERALPSLSLLEGSDSGVSGAILGYSVAYPNITGEANLTPGKVVSVDLSRSAAGSYAAFVIGRGGEIAPGGSSGSRRSTYSFVARGVYSKFGQGIFFNPDSSIFVPLSEGPAIKQSNNYSGIFVVARNASSVNATVSAIESIIGSDARVITTSSILSSIESIESSASALLFGIAGISLIVAFTGIMTTMFTAVTERIKEIGVMKALGFTSRQVMALFVTESLVIGFIGGAIGVGIGGLASYAGAPLLTGGLGGRTASMPGNSRQLSASPVSGVGSSSLQIALDPALMAEVVVLTTAMGALAGLLPAWRASKLIPAEALRSL